MATEQVLNRVPNQRKGPGTFTAVLVASNTALSWQMTVVAPLLLALCVGLCSCALTPNYNPASLSASQSAKIQKICQTVMGLSSAGGLYDNLWAGDPDPEAVSDDCRRAKTCVQRSRPTGTAQLRG
jgi:hypothetical protein